MKKISLATIQEIRETLENESFYWSVGFYALIIGTLAHTIYFLIFIWLGSYLLGVLNLLGILLFLYCIFIVGIPTIVSKDDRLIGWLVYVDLIVVNLVELWFLGKSSGFQFFIYLLAALPFFISSYPKWLYLLRIGFVIFLAWLIETAPYFHSPHSAIPIDTDIIRTFHLLNITLFLVIMAFLSYTYSVLEYDYRQTLHSHLLHDPLTRLKNRHYLQSLLTPNEWIDLPKEKRGMLLLDIDYFKKINDRLGHECGDRTLEQFSNRLTELCDTALIIRWGGEEFLLFVDASDTKELEERAKTVHQKLQKLKIKCGENQFSITITIGGTLLKEEETFLTAFKRADEALYRGKNSGRNRIEIS